jgi:hypothetical protein
MGDQKNAKHQSQCQLLTLPALRQLDQLSAKHKF